jgi:hypothetical protein
VLEVFAAPTGCCPLVVRAKSEIPVEASIATSRST